MFKLNGLKQRIRLSTTEKRDLFQALSQLLKSGIPLPDCLQMLTQETAGRQLKAYLEATRSAVETGETLVAAMNQWQHNIDSLAMALIETGEQTGQLDGILAILSEAKQHELDGLQALKKALFYPLVSLALGVGVAFFMLVTVLPQFQALYEQMGHDPPIYTRWLIMLSEIIRHPNAYDVLNSLWLTYLLIELITSFWFRQWFIGTVVKWPPWRGLVYHKEMYFIFNAWLSFNKASIPLTAMTERLVNMRGFLLFHPSLEAMHQQLCEGQSLQQVLTDLELFKPRIRQMLSIGESTGELRPMILEARQYSFQLLTTRINRLSQLAEPLVLGLLAFMIGGLMLAMYMPLFNLGQAF